MRKLASLLLSMAVIGLTLTACDSSSPSVDAPRSDANDIRTLVYDAPGNLDDILKIPVFSVCKFAPDDPMQLFTFETSVVGSVEALDTFVPSVSLRDGECEDVFIDRTGNDLNEVTVTEVVPNGWQLDKVDVTTATVEADGSVTVDAFEAAGPSITVTIVQSKIGAKAIFYNSKMAVPTGGEGCTPGAWKNRLLKLDRWPVPSNTLLSDVWNVPASFNGLTLLDALKFKGGSSFDAKVQILLRAATAAYLNSLSVNYDLTTQQIIDGGNAAIASGNPDEVIALATTLDDFNNQTCLITE